MVKANLIHNESVVKRARFVLYFTQPCLTVDSVHIKLIPETLAILFTYESHPRSIKSNDRLIACSGRLIPCPSDIHELLFHSFIDYLHSFHNFSPFRWFDWNFCINLIFVAVWFCLLCNVFYTLFLLSLCVCVSPRGICLPHIILVNVQYKALCAISLLIYWRYSMPTRSKPASSHWELCMMLHSVPPPCPITDSFLAMQQL